MIVLRRSLILLILCFPQLSLTKNSESHLKILSWNIFQIPKPINWTRQLKRSKAIAQKLSNSNYDIIGLQEVFTHSARNKIIDSIKKKYPYITQNFRLNRGGQILSSGLMVISKYPMRILEHIFFKDCKSFDCLSAKGAILVEIDHPKGKVQVLNTHLQASQKFHNIRKKQLKEIRAMLARNKKQSAARIYLGDFNIDFYEQNEFNQLQEILDIVPYQLNSGYRYSYGELSNSFRKGRERAQLLDYIFVDKKNFHIEEKSITTLQKFLGDWRKKLDLSDHYAVEKLIEFSN